jgi:hypothetical protein
MSHSNQCIECLHNLGDWKCDAFPKGIPEEIATGEHDHTKPFKGDNGIRFEHIKKWSEETAGDEWKRRKNPKPE